MCVFAAAARVFACVSIVSRSEGAGPLACVFFSFGDRFVFLLIDFFFGSFRFSFSSSSFFTNRQ